MRAANHVAVAIQVLRHGVDGDIDAKLDRPLEVWGHEGVIYHRDETVRLAKRGGGTEVCELEQWVGGRLNPEHARRWVACDRRLNRPLLREVYVIEC